MAAVEISSTGVGVRGAGALWWSSGARIRDGALGGLPVKGVGVAQGSEGRNGASMCQSIQRDGRKRQTCVSARLCKRALPRYVQELKTTQGYYSKKKKVNRGFDLAIGCITEVGPICHARPNVSKSN